MAEPKDGKAALAIIQSAAQQASKHNGIKLQETAGDRYFNEPTHKAAAEVLLEAMGSRVIYEKESGKYYERTPADYYEEITDILTRSSGILTAATSRAFTKAAEGAHGAALQNAYLKAGQALRKSETREYNLSALSFFAESVLVPDLASKWNASPDCLPTITGILDYSGDEILRRKPREDEYFKDPLPIEADRVLTPDIPAAFSLALFDFFPDPEVRRTAIECLSLAVSNKGSRVFQVYHGEAGANGKNTLLDMLRIALPGRVGTISASAITRGQDGGARRFGAAELEGLTFAAIDEVTGAFDVSEVKRLTGGSVVSIEKKGRDGYEIPQRWALAALTNKLPSFQPATDSAFLQRLIIVPFDSVFYFDDIQREEYLRLGIDESKLKPARNKEELLAQIQGERPAIIRFLIETYQAMRKAGGRPYECGRSLQIKQTYQGQNDLVAAFFLEYLERDPAGRVEYSRILDLWKTYTGEKAASIREITKRLIERFPWIEKRISHSTRFLAGIKELDGGEEKQRQPEDEAKGKALALDEKSIELGYGGTENDTFHLRAGKNEKSHSKMETPLFRTPVPEICAKPAPMVAEPSPEAPRVYDEFLRILELHERNLSAAGQDPGRALVELIELRLQCGKAGILGDSFSKAFEELRGQGLIEYQDPHIFAPLRQAARV